MENGGSFLWVTFFNAAIPFFFDFLVSKKQDDRPNAYESSELPRSSWKEAADACTIKIQHEDRGEAQKVLWRGLSIGMVLFFSWYGNIMEIKIQGKRSNMPSASVSLSGLCLLPALDNPAVPSIKLGATALVFQLIPTRPLSRHETSARSPSNLYHPNIHQDHDSNVSGGLCAEDGACLRNVARRKGIIGTLEAALSEA